MLRFSGETVLMPKNFSVFLCKNLIPADCQKGSCYDIICIAEILPPLTLGERHENF